MEIIYGLVRFYYNIIVFLKLYSNCSEVKNVRILKLKLLFYFVKVLNITLLIQKLLFFKLL